MFHFNMLWSKSVYCNSSKVLSVCVLRWLFWISVFFLLVSNRTNCYNEIVWIYSKNVQFVSTLCNKRWCIGSRKDSWCHLFWSHHFESHICTTLEHYFYVSTYRWFRWVFVHIPDSNFVVGYFILYGSCIFTTSPNNRDIFNVSTDFRWL